MKTNGIEWMKARLSGLALFFSSSLPLQLSWAAQISGLLVICFLPNEAKRAAQPLNPSSILLSFYIPLSFQSSLLLSILLAAVLFLFSLGWAPREKKRQGKACGALSLTLFFHPFNQPTHFFGWLDGGRKRERAAQINQWMDNELIYGWVRCKRASGHNPPNSIDFISFNQFHLLSSWPAAPFID